MEKTFAIDSKQAAAALEHPTSRHIVMELIAKACSLGELSQGLNVSLSLLTYHIVRLRRLKLVQVVDDANRAGRKIKRYRAAAREFFVPTAIASRPTQTALAEELRATLERDRVSQRNVGTLYFIDDQGRRRMRRIDSAQTGGTFETWMIVEMDAPGAKAFANELRALIAKHAIRKAEKSRPFLLHCALAPKRGRKGAL